ncbi:hypothetical protein CEXT_613911 [Caerostris extrusa]|uniref:Uncharacterized protein n=1 Tax=Caerostris extrusa TaxID=172846 RepID=A0AAV4NEL1_CAEEX|nr:hypothetical protein CEXT_613911 [Caerostris extrusa]
MIRIPHLFRALCRNSAEIRGERLMSAASILIRASRTARFAHFDPTGSFHVFVKDLRIFYLAGRPPSFPSNAFLSRGFSFGRCEGGGCRSFVLAAGDTVSEGEGSEKGRRCLAEVPNEAATGARRCHQMIRTRSLVAFDKHCFDNFGKTSVRSWTDTFLSLLFAASTLFGTCDEVEISLHRFRSSHCFFSDGSRTLRQTKQSPVRQLQSVALKLVDTKNCCTKFVSISTY